LLTKYFSTIFQPPKYLEELENLAGLPSHHCIASFGASDSQFSDQQKRVRITLPHINTFSMRQTIRKAMADETYIHHQPVAKYMAAVSDKLRR
jgi:hypothetical protein